MNWSKSLCVGKESDENGELHDGGNSRIKPPNGGKRRSRGDNDEKSERWK